MTPLMAPEAPTIGMPEAGLKRTCRRAAATPRNQVEDREAHAPHRVLDVVTEDPQEPHVADQVHPGAVQEHRGENVRDLPAGISDADETLAHRERRAGPQCASEHTRNKPLVS